METDSTLSSIALVVSLVFYAIASLSEASVASVRRERLQNLVFRGASAAATLDRLHSLPMGPTGALYLVKIFTFSASLLSAVALIVALEGVRWMLIALVALAALALLIIMRSATSVMASIYGERIAFRISIVVRVLTWLLNPILTAEERLRQRVLGERAGNGNSSPTTVPVEIDLPLDSAVEPLEEHEVRMIRGVVQLDKTTAREIMVPRVDMVAVEKGTSIAELTEEMVKRGHSRIPVYADDLDQIEGIAYARDVLSQLSDGSDTSGITVENVIRPALFIPESKTLEELLSEFQQMRMHMAIVVDEYGGVSGLVTIKDLLEEIVGDIQDEFDVGAPEVELVGDHQFVMDAGVSIDHLNELLTVSLEGDGFDTLGGFVYQRLGKIPSPGDIVDYDGVRIEVISTAGRRLKKLRVTKPMEGEVEAHS